MKITCDCGNEAEFVEDYDENLFINEWGTYTTMENGKFSFGEEHDKIGIRCHDCGKDIWMFI